MAQHPDHDAPAFTLVYSEDEYAFKGMTLRDWFAGQALAALAATTFGEAQHIAKAAYMAADAMLAERVKSAGR